MSKASLVRRQIGRACSEWLDRGDRSRQILQGERDGKSHIGWVFSEKDELALLVGPEVSPPLHFLPLTHV
jgi:hypothetical protein